MAEKFCLFNSKIGKKQPHVFLIPVQIKCWITNQNKIPILYQLLVVKELPWRIDKATFNKVLLLSITRIYLSYHYPIL